VAGPIRRTSLSGPQPEGRRRRLGEAGDLIPSAGEVIRDIASVNEAASHCDRPRSSAIRPATAPRGPAALKVCPRIACV